MDAESSWSPIDLGPILDGDDLDPRPALLTREDDAQLLYPGRVHSISGEPESCKTWLVLLAAAETLLDDVGRVLYLDFEESPAAIVHRLLALGVKRDVIGERFHYARPLNRLDDAAHVALDRVLRDGVQLAVVDGVTEALGTLGLDLASNTDVARFAALLTRPIADAGPAVVQLDHLSKHRESGDRFALGAQHKLAGLDGAAYLLEVIEPFGHGRIGRIRILVAKDRLGRIREKAGGDGKHAGTLVLRSEPDGTVFAEVHPPTPGEWKPTALMAKIATALAARGEPMTGRQIRDAIPGKTKFVLHALNALIEDGHVESVPGPRGSTRHLLVSPLPTYWRRS